METREALCTRRSVRSYRPDPVPRDVLEDILRSACCAPSAVNRQRWYFAAVQDPEQMTRLREIMGRVSERFRPVLEQRYGTDRDSARQRETFLAGLGGAPVCVLAFLLEPEDTEQDRDGAMQSISAAIENLLLAAWDRGLGTCWMASPQRMGFGAELQRNFAPGRGEFVAAITLGYPGAIPEMPPRLEGRYTIV